jgi:hypothetical protein
MGRSPVQAAAWQVQDSVLAGEPAGFCCICELASPAKIGRGQRPDSCRKAGRQGVFERSSVTGPQQTASRLMGTDGR